MNLGNIMLSERGHKLFYVQNTQIHRQKVENVEIGSNYLMGIGFFSGNKNVLDLDSGDGCITMKVH